MSSAMHIEELFAENKKLKRALVHAIPWIGVSKYGPSWATDEAKKINLANCNYADDLATSCFSSQDEIDAAWSNT